MRNEYSHTYEVRVHIHTYGGGCDSEGGGGRPLICRVGGLITGSACTQAEVSFSTTLNKFSLLPSGCECCKCSVFTVHVQSARAYPSETHKTVYMLRHTHTYLLANAVHTHALTFGATRQVG